MGTVYLGEANPMGSGGGGSITVDQTYDATSTNAQSGTAVAEAIATVPTYSAGTNVTISNGVISATDTTYSAFTGATSQAAGATGLVPAPATTDVDKYLKGDGTWGAVSGGGLQNTAAPNTGSLTILGTPANAYDSVNIGDGAEVVDDGFGIVAIGAGVTAGTASVAIGGYDGGSPTSAVNYSTVIGWEAHADSGYSVVVGSQASAETKGTAIGYAAYTTGDCSIALGANAESTVAYEFVVGGKDQNSDPTSYKLMDLATGKIPNDRINGVSGSFTTNDGKTVTVTNGVITAIA